MDILYTLYQRYEHLLQPQYYLTLSAVDAWDCAVAAATVFLVASPYLAELLSAKERKIPNSHWYTVPQATGAWAESRQRTQETRLIIRAFEEQELDFMVFWGSQSGRAELIAQQFAKSLHDKFDLRARAADLGDFDISSLKSLKQQHRVAFFLATYGDGEPPDNANDLWRFLHDCAKQSNHELPNLQYVLFGLGNSNYRQYNHVAQVIDERLQDVGATRLCTSGLGDDALGKTEQDYQAWRTSAFREIKATLNLVECENGYRPAFTVSESIPGTEDTIFSGKPWSSSQEPIYSRASVSQAMQIVQIAGIRSLWETEERICLHMGLDLGQDRTMKYRTGDHLSVWVCNPDHEVDQVFSCLDLSLKRHAPVRIQQQDSSSYGRVPVPALTTLDALFRSYLEICGIVSLDLVGALVDFAPSSTALDTLLHIYKSTEEFESLIVSRKTTLGGLLWKLSNGGREKWNVPVSFFIERLKPMRPRLYSIATSAMAHPQTVSIAAVVDKPWSPKDDENSLSNGCFGLATNYLWHLQRVSNSKNPECTGNLPSYSLRDPQKSLMYNRIYCSTIQSSFKLPAKASTPIIMVGAGTGVAPLRAFVEERVHCYRIQGGQIGKILLLMGFRNSQTDFIYESDWINWQQELGDDLFSYSTAFSRDGNETKYVQDVMHKQADQIMELLEIVGCRFYICGSARMARNVTETLLQLKTNYSGCDRSQAMDWMKGMRKFKTLLEDVWG